jgi:hypothetical protein
MNLRARDANLQYITDENMEDHQLFGWTDFLMLSSGTASTDASKFRSRSASLEDAG